MDISFFKEQITNLILDLSNQDYDKISADGRTGRLDTTGLKKAIDDYGCKIVPLPENAFSLAETYPADENAILIYLPLWTQEEGRSDLTISLDCLLKDSKPLAKINDLRVL